MALASATRAAITRVRHQHFHPDFLQGELIVNRAEQRDCPIVGHLRATQLDAGTLPRELRMCVRHLAVEEERHIGVEFFLQLDQPHLGTVPRPRFIHGQEHFIGFLIKAEKIDHIRVLDTATRGVGRRNARRLHGGRIAILGHAERKIMQPWNLRSAFSFNVAGAAIE